MASNGLLKCLPTRGLSNGIDETYDERGLLKIKDALYTNEQNGHVLRDIRKMLDELYPKMDSIDYKGIFTLKNKKPH